MPSLREIRRKIRLLGELLMLLAVIAVPNGMAQNWKTFKSDTHAVQLRYPDGCLVSEQGKWVSISQFVMTGGIYKKLGGIQLEFQENANSGHKDLDSWARSYFMENPLEKHRAKKYLKIGGMPAVKLTDFVGPNRHRFYVARGTDIVEIAYDPDPGNESVWEKIITSISFPERRQDAE
jgi:hypothetical protein